MLPVLNPGEVRFVLLLHRLEVRKKRLRRFRRMASSPQMRQDLTLPLHMDRTLADMPLNHL